MSHFREQFALSLETPEELDATFQSCTSDWMRKTVKALLILGMWEQARRSEQLTCLVKLHYPQMCTISTESVQGAQWLSGRVLDSRPRVRASPASLRCGL